MMIPHAKEVDQWMKSALESHTTQLVDALTKAIVELLRKVQLEGTVSVTYCAIYTADVMAYAKDKLHDAFVDKEFIVQFMELRKVEDDPYSNGPTLELTYRVSLNYKNIYPCDE